MADAERERRLREAAANRGLKLVKSRRRKPGAGDYGKFGLTDAEGRPLLGNGKHGLTASAEEIEAFLHKGLVADWKGSLKQPDGPALAARKKQPPVAEADKREEAPPARRGGLRHSRREAAAAPDPPAGPELVVREARPADSEAIAALVATLGFETPADELSTRLSRLRKSGEAPLVAERGEVIGCLAWHVTPVLHRPRPVGRITMMVVAEGERRRGVGRALAEAAAERCAAKGCGLIEVTSNIDLGPAHAFYRRLGFERTSHRFAREL